MSELIAIGYPDKTTAYEAMDEVQRLSEQLVIQPDAVAAGVRNDDGKFRVTTNHHEVGAGTTWGMFWGFLFGILFFVPVLGMAVGAWAPSWARSRRPASTRSSSAGSATC